MKQFKQIAARTRHASLPIFHRPDHIAEKYYHLSPYTYCAGDPLNYIDPTGCKVTLYFTKLPINCPGPRDAVSVVGTHSFLHIKNDKVDMVVAYRSETDKATSGKLVRQTYKQDRQVVKSSYGAIRSQVLKKEYEIMLPDGMTESEFDNKVIGR